MGGYGRRPRDPSASERGQAAVEFALVAGLLMTLLMGIFDLGRAVAVSASLANAVNEGARLSAYGAEGAAEQQAIRDAVCDYASLAPGLSCAPGGDVTVTLGGSPRSATIQVAYDFAPVTPLIGKFLPGGKITVGATASAVVP